MKKEKELNKQILKTRRKADKLFLEIIDIQNKMMLLRL